MPGPKLTFTDGRTMPVGKIVCLGRNYRAHAKEMGVEPPKEPVIFIKPASSVIGDGDDIIIPEGIGEVHHEVELAVVIGGTCKDARSTFPRRRVADGKRPTPFLSLLSRPAPLRRGVAAIPRHELTTRRHALY